MIYYYIRYYNLFSYKNLVSYIGGKYIPTKVYKSKISENALYMHLRLYISSKILFAHYIIENYDGRHGYVIKIKHII